MSIKAKKKSIKSKIPNGFYSKRQKILMTILAIVIGVITLVLLVGIVLMILFFTGIITH